MDEEKREHIEEAIETLNSRGWQDVIIPEFVEAYNLLLIDLKSKHNDRDTDLYVKGQINILESLLNLKDEYKKRLK